MSKVTIAGDVNGTGVFTIAAPNGNTNRTLTLPDETGTMALQGGAGVGKVLQVVNFQTGAMATGTTTIPSDNTIPQITEGSEFMTLEITPTSTASTLLIDVFFFGSNSIATDMVVALFQDTTADALAASAFFVDNNTARAIVSFRHKMTAGTASATTFKVRAGPASTGTIILNGSGSTGRYGGVAASSITITEVAA